jgi:type IV pilus assembly protein PilB
VSSPNVPTPGSARKKVDDLLVEMRLVSPADLEEVLPEARRLNLSCGEILTRLGRLSREHYGAALGQLYNVRYVPLAKTEIDPTVLDLLPEEFIREKQIVPVANAGGRLVIAMVDPSDRPTIDEVTFMTGMRPQPVVISLFDFEEFQRKTYVNSAPSNLLETINTAQSSMQVEESDLLRQQREAELSDQSNPIVKLVSSILHEAIERNASDIHIEPRTRKYSVRFRVDGILRTVLDIPANMQASLVTRIKVMASMDIADHRRPQDGRMTVNHKNTEYNLRVNSLPVTEGREKIVIRILRPSRSIADFTTLGFDPQEIKKLELLYKAPYGIILVCGPTGSGKTTTLYTVLNKINDDIRNISTVEDPVELVIEGLNQSQVNAKADYTFASSMRALLRQDPDVIMVGEIRDYETLEAAIHAALTGHLVFSTIHSNSTAATVTRMIEMGASATLIGSALNGIIAQRLVRGICPHCKASYKASEEEKKILFPYDADRQAADISLWRGKGCNSCNNSGYSGRTGVYEILTVDREIRQLINGGSSDLEIEDAAVAAGMRTLAMNGRAKVLAGATTLDEVVRVLGINLSG